ncbi:hypothetical protein Q5P01_013245 [Channa striata]|uniref:CARD domain-containing protein n=1 Tax=Channa striata TaxID=64152 RepID=A0AA88SN40_CHASR|nr:hypothetical protein Q5P01_013245 [Channa striata]
MALDKLTSGQDRLCEWLSEDSDHIIEQCDDILSLKEYKEIEKQTCPLKKMQVLLKIIIQKGEDTCQIFMDILKKNQEQYKQLQPFFNSHLQHTVWSPTVAADNTSVVTAREITGVKAKSLNITTEVIGPGSNSSGIFGGQAAQANYSASGNSLICADKISYTTIDGDINLSATVKSSQHSAEGNRSLPSSQDPAVKTIREHKDGLIDCLMGDCVFILNRVHARGIITSRQYQNLKDLQRSEETVVNLIDQVMSKGQQSCACLLNVLRESEVLETYPRLRDILKEPW